MAKKKYGTTAWGEWFLKMLDSYDGSGRLSRGKTYANTGRVEDIRVEGQTVNARVAGRYESWYNVVITFPKISDTMEKKVIKVLKNNPVSLEALRSGFMQDDLIQEFEKNNIRLIPAQWGKLTRFCSCPDIGNPCKHMAAVLFILAREIDYDPRLIFQLGGFDLNSQELSSTIAVDDEKDVFVQAERSFQIDEPIPVSVRKKKTAEEILNGNDGVLTGKKKILTFPSAESYIPLVTSFLPKNPVFSISDFVPKMTEFYHTALSAYDFNFYANQVEAENVENIFYAHIEIDTKQIGKSKHSFPLSKSALPTMNIKFSKSNALGFSLLQAGILFSAKPLNFDSLSESYCIAYSFFQLAKKIVRDSAFIPAVNVCENELSVFWKPLTASTEINLAIDSFANILTEEFFPLLKKWGRRYSAELLLTAYLTEYVLSLDFSPRLSSGSDREIDALFFRDYIIDTSVPGNKNLATVIYTWLAVLNYEQNEFLYRLNVKIKDEETIELFAEVAKLDEINTKFETLSTAVKNSADKSKILKFPIVLASYLPEMAELASKKSIELTLDETADFLQEASKLLERFGVEILLPKALQRTLKPRAVLSVGTKSPNTAVQSFLKLADLLEYDTKIMLGDFEISVAEFKKLVNENSKLIKFNDQYILLDPEEVAQLFSNLERSDELTPMDLMQSILTEEAELTVDARMQVDSIFKSEILTTPKTLNARLRPYQEKGFSWMYANIKSGFGCLLADDMGLGKTIQIITLILTLKEKNELGNGVIIVAPTSLISNWRHEISKFAPSLSCNIYHGYGRQLIPNTDITITTYQTMQKDINKIIEHNFFGTIIDEAQSIKNANTKTATSLKKLKTDFRIAMTGTPVENSLEDMRAIFDFILPNYLGDVKTFRKKWRIPIELHSNTEIGEQLKKITAPFVLRRLKTDKSIISDLPEKVTSNTYCNLTGVQVAMYEALVNTQLDTALKAESEIKRKALILKMLTGLKQICNHPRAFDKNSPPVSELSGKIISLKLMLKEILANGEKALIFSQYVETINILKKVIENELQTTALTITGRMKPETRQENVELFQTDSSYRILLISLKAGGTGLNLTSANHVIHFDLWYNPAVEDQATDRAFRIGQKTNVFVHRLICEGTFEEKIDQMIQKKREIAETVSGGETWISKLTNTELKEILSLKTTVEQ